MNKQIIKMFKPTELSRLSQMAMPFGTRLGRVLSRHTAKTDPFGTRIGRVAIRRNGSVWDQVGTGSQYAYG